MHKKRLFISRPLGAHSAFHRLSSHLDIFDLSLLSFETITVEQIPDCQWLFFYSQQGVIHFFKQAKATWFRDKRIASFGQKTAQLLSQHTALIHFIGNGRARDTAPALELIVRENMILFVRAKDSMRSVQMSTQLQAKELIVYDNRGLDDFSLPHCDILIFTSPLNAKTYFSKYKKEKGQTIFAIGESTASTLHALVGGEVIVPPNPSEGALLSLVQDYF